METLKKYTLSEMEDRYIGKIGTPERDAYENELRMDLLAHSIKSTRKERGLTQEALGKLAGIGKSQISKLENHVNNATIGTILKVFNALKAEVQFNVKLGSQPLQLA